MNELDQLGARWSKELRFRIIGDQRLGAALTGRARVLVGATERLRSMSPGYVSKSERYPDGASIRVFYTGREWIAEIDVSGVTTAPTTTGEMWIPTGLVFTPANDDAMLGYGIPVNVNATSPLDPGIVSDQWSANGALAQALLTDQPNAGYPSTLDSVPLYFDTYEQPPGDIKLTHSQTWAVFKPRFRDLGTGFMAILDETNDRRDHDQPLCPPLFGYADIAAELSRLARNFGLDPASYPIGSRTAARQVEKEGTVKIDPSTGSPRGVIGTGTIAAGASVDEIVDEIDAALPALTDSTLKKGASFSLVGAGQYFAALLDNNDHWIKTGNIDWRSIHAEIPGLSWFGSRGRSIPSWELGCGLTQNTEHDGTIAPPVTFSSYMLDATITDFNGMKMVQFSPCIFSQGRLLAVLPNSGYCLGAAIQKLDPDDDNPTTRYMLFAIAWHRADQRYQTGTIDVSAPDALYWDTTSNIRIWKAEVTFRNGLISPDYYINDILDPVNNPNGWTELSPGGYRLSGVTPSFSHWLGDYPEQGDYSTDEFNAAKAYWQTWMFNGSGTEAMCIRSAVYVQRSSGFLIQTGCAYPSHALHLDVHENSTFISSYFEQSNIFDIGHRLCIALDYVGDELRAAYFGGPSGNELDGSLRIETTSGQALVSWEAFVDPASMCFAYDARYDAAIINTTTLAGGLVDTNTLSIFIRGSLEGQSSWPGQTDYVVGYLGWAVNFNIAYGPQWMEIDGHPDTIPALAVNDTQFVAGVWHGSVPGSAHGPPPYTKATGYHTLAREFRSSFDRLDEALKVPNGWFDYAGVCG